MSTLHRQLHCTNRHIAYSVVQEVDQFNVNMYSEI